ncbi:MAG TPA: DMT family transporter [Candidatus Nanopelagicaceae bacterium]
MSRRSWFLFLLVGLLWGIPYLLIRVAVRDLSPALVVFARVAIGAAILIPISIHQKSFASAVRGLKYVLVYALAEIIVPWFLITKAETNLSSGLAGLLVATVPIWSTIFASLTGDKTVWHRKRLIGLIVGFLGLIALVGIESFTGQSAHWAILSILLAAVGYGYAVNMITQKLPNVSGIAINAVAMAMATVVYAPFALLQWPHAHVSTNSLLATIALGVLPTALAFVLFFKVMEEIGPARASLVTYLNTACAVVLGVVILSEPVTLGMTVGLPMVLIGSYLASRKPVYVENLEI